MSKSYFVGDYFISLSYFWGAKQITIIYMKSIQPYYELPNFQKISQEMFKY